MSRSVLAVLLATAFGAAAHAQVLVAADNGAESVYSNNFAGPYSLDGTNTSLSFKTTKANETVAFSFAAGVCGIEQTAAQTSQRLNETYVGGYFYLDGGLVYPPNPNGFYLCYYNQLPQVPGMIQSATGQMQQRVVIAKPGVHTISVAVNIYGSFGDGTGIGPFFGLTHVEVRH